MNIDKNFFWKFKLFFKNAPQYIAVLLLLIFLIQEFIVSQQNLFHEGDTISDFEGHSIQKNHKTFLKEYSEPFLLINFFATWCDPCVAEIPDLVLFANKHISKRFILLGLAAQSGSFDDISSFVKKHNISYPVIMIDDETLNHYHIQSFPTTVLVGPPPERKVLWHTTSSVSFQSLEDILEEKIPSQITKE